MKRNDKKFNIGGGIAIYKTKDGGPDLAVKMEKGTVWLTLNQLASLFYVNKSSISRHIFNIFKTGELLQSATVAKIATVQKEGEREIVRQIEYYNLDAIISVGYRVNSKKATLFRQWATKTLRSYIIDGFVVNKDRIAENYSQFLKVVDDIKKLLPAEAEIKAGDAIELISLFADTWLSLDAYDRDNLEAGRLTAKPVELSPEKISDGLTQLREELIRKSEATELFGQERSRGAVTGIIGNIMQSFGGQELYGSVEEKAAHLLYFMVKNHPYSDGNKRSGAFAFIWFLKQADILDVSRLTPPALTALTLLVASSHPKDKDKVVSLILNLIAK